MQPFTCPQCGHQSSFDPWGEAAQCPQCGFSPPTDGPRYNYVRWARRYAYQPFLDELSAHWNGTHTPELAFALDASEDAVGFFRQYQRLVGVETPNYCPNRQEILLFVEAYVWLRRGERAKAANDLWALTVTSPLFVEPWIWLTATTDDPATRQKFLETATRLDSGHALARDALAMAQGRISLHDGRWEEEITVVQCPQCGGALRYEPGAAKVTCSYCDHQLAPWESSLIDEEATPIPHLRLKRHFKGHTWAEAQRIASCRACGAQIIMTEHLARLCTCCGSPDVLSEDNQPTLEQPDGLLPFLIDKQQAKHTVHRAQRSVPGRLATWWTGQEWEVKDVQGVYLPFWIFDGIVETYQIYRGLASQRKASLKWDTYENLVFPGVSVPPRSLLARVYPFDLSVLTPYEPRLLADWPARLYNLDVELVAEEARNAMLRQTRRQAPRRPKVVKRFLAFQVIGLTYQLVLLPVWLAFMESEDHRRLALLNGQTGTMALGLTSLQTS
jgi:LSD1 subclass zinc finger protein